MQMLSMFIKEDPMANRRKRVINAVYGGGGSAAQLGRLL